MFLRHEQCPKCAESGRDRKQNNLGIWDDHKWCFACGYFEGENAIDKFKMSQLKPIPQCGIENRLPEDSGFLFPKEPLAWIKSYGITDAEMETHHVMWSEYKKLLIFPIVGCNMDLIAWIGRYFGPNKDHPKYFTYGIKQNLFHFIGEPHDTVVLVEDIISAIKVGRSNCAMPLFCADINKYQLFRLAQMFDKLCIWLDPDKRQHSIKLAGRANSFFDQTRIIYSDVDPKDLTDAQIKEFLK